MAGGARRALTEQKDPADGKLVLTPPSEVDPVLAGLLAAYRKKAQATAVALHADRVAFAQTDELAGLDPFGPPDQLPQHHDDADLIPASIKRADGARWHRSNESENPPRDLPDLSLVKEDRARIAPALSPAVRKAVRLGLYEKPVLEWTDPSMGGFRFDGGENNGNLVVTRLRQKSLLGERLVPQWQDSLYFHGRVTLSVRLMFRPKAGNPASPTPVLPYLDRTVTPRGDLLGFARSGAVQAGDVRPRLSLDLEAIRKERHGTLIDFDHPPEEARLPGDKRWAKWLMTELPEMFRDPKNPIAARFAESPGRDLLSDEALVIRDDGYSAPDVAARLFPTTTEEKQSSLMAGLMKSRSTLEELKALQSTALYLKDGKPLLGRDVALKALIDSRTDSDLAGYWGRRSADELALRAKLDSDAAARVAKQLNDQREILLEPISELC